MVNKGQAAWFGLAWLPVVCEKHTSMLVAEEALNYYSGVPTKSAFPAALYGVNTSN